MCLNSIKIVVILLLHKKFVGTVQVAKITPEVTPEVKCFVLQGEMSEYLHNIGGTDGEIVWFLRIMQYNSTHHCLRS